MASATLKMPGVMELEIFRLAVVECRSKASIAELLGIKDCGAIGSALQKVQAYMQQAIAEEMEVVPEEKRKAHSQQVAAMRLDHLWGETMRAFDASQADFWQLTRRTNNGIPGEWKEIRKPSYGEVKYLMAAMRICLQLSKLPYAILPLFGMKNAPEKPLRRAASAPPMPPTAAAQATPEQPVEQQASQPSNPPVRDCSAKSAAQDQGKRTSAEASSVNGSFKSAYENKREPKEPLADAKNDEKDPVQTPVDEPSIDIDELFSSPPRTRQQRRARQRELERWQKRSKGARIDAAS